MQNAYRHEAVPYRGHDEFVSSCLSVVQEALVRNERLIFLLGADKLAGLREAVGRDAEDIAFVPTDEHGQNPARITTLLHGFHAASDGRRCVGINESVFPGRSGPALVEAHLAESVLNAPDLRSWQMSVVCLYDRGELDDAHLLGMRRSHPVIRGEDDNTDYEPELADKLFAEPLDETSERVETRVVGTGELAEMRAFVRGAAAREGLSADRLDDLVLAANEVVTNSLRYGGQTCRVAMWRAGDSVVCEVRDPGRIRDPLVGRLAPPPTATTGRGLWLANHLCDLAQIRSSQDGTVVRLFVDR
jgi:anti-sigma regulatory factor (Ser/Thr protein kinase)